MRRKTTLVVVSFLLSWTFVLFLAFVLFCFDFASLSFSFYWMMGQTSELLSRCRQHRLSDQSTGNRNHCMPFLDLPFKLLTCIL